MKTDEEKKFDELKLTHNILKSKYKNLEDENERNKEELTTLKLENKKLSKMLDKLIDDIVSFTVYDNPEEQKEILRKRLEKGINL